MYERWEKREETGVIAVIRKVWMRKMLKAGEEVK